MSLDVRCVRARKDIKKSVKKINMSHQSVQPCGGEIIEPAVGMIGCKTCSRYGSRLRMCTDDITCYVVWKEFACMISSVNCGKCLLEKLK